MRLRIDICIDNSVYYDDEGKLSPDAIAQQMRGIAQKIEDDINGLDFAIYDLNGNFVGTSERA